LEWFERGVFSAAKVRNVSIVATFQLPIDSPTCRRRYAQSSPGPADELDEEIHCDFEH
jgi:hypothetical protein